MTDSDLVHAPSSRGETLIGPGQWQVDPDTGCVTAWRPAGWPEPLRLVGGGCEFGNWMGFFAHERLGGRSCRIQRIGVRSGDSGRCTSEWHVRMPKARFRAAVDYQMDGASSIRQTLQLTAQADPCAWIGDAVARCVVPWQPGLVAEIEDRVVEHQDADRREETEGEAVFLRWPDGRRLEFHWADPADLPPWCTRYLYVRDQPILGTHRHCAQRSWVLHARLLVEQPAAYVWQLGRRYMVLWSRGVLGRYLVDVRRLHFRWRAGELCLGGRGQLLGIWPLAPGATIGLQVQLKADVTR